MWCSGISPVAKGWNTDIRLLAFSYGCAEVTGYKFGDRMVQQKLNCCFSKQLGSVVT